MNGLHEQPKHIVEPETKFTLHQMVIIDVGLYKDCEAKIVRVMPGDDDTNYLVEVVDDKQICIYDESELHISQ